MGNSYLSFAVKSMYPTPEPWTCPRPKYNNILKPTSTHYTWSQQLVWKISWCHSTTGYTHWCFRSGRTVLSLSSKFRKNLFFFKGTI